MKNTENTLDSERLKLLEALDDRAYSAEDFESVLAALLDNTPGLFLPHDPGSYAINTDETIWHRNNFDYFERQKDAAKRNFSETRWRHLLTVRSYFRDRNYKGFEPMIPFTSRPSVQATSEATPLTTMQKEKDMYQPSEILERYVAEGDVTAIRAILKDELRSRFPAKQDLLDTMQWVKRKKQEVFVQSSEVHEAMRDTHAIKLKPEDGWTADYHDRQIVCLENNFSEELFLHLVDVREYLRQRGEPGFRPLKKVPEETSAQGEKKSAPSSIRPSRLPDDTMSSTLKKILAIGGALAVLLTLLFLGR
jgi:hypothetical protein